MNEFELIARLCRHLPSNPSTVVGAGDDCAVLDLGLADRRLLFKTDAVVAGVHYRPEADPNQVGHKALARCLSDVAAMGGVPTHAVVTLGLPRDYALDWVDGVYAGLGALARRYGVAIVGGETTTSPDRTFLSVALLGWVEADRCVLRSGAEPGDALFVTGELGGALRSGRHLTFEPRLTEARWLTEHHAVHAMIDLSDGLAGDVKHLLQSSGCGAEILAEALPVSRAAREAARTGGKTALAGALSDGEDFELLFAVGARDAVVLLDGWKARFPEIRLSCVGKITQDPGVTVRDRTGQTAASWDGYVHFQNS